MQKTEKTPRTDNIRLREILGKFCDGYCIYPRRPLKREELEFRCEHCPAQEIVAYVDELRGKFDC